jgi:guanine nucleotide-binding protein subunit alpha
LDIDAQISKDAKILNNDTKMLLLGPGESGKSTLFKQMKILAREGGYSEAELEKYKSNIYTNCISQMQKLCEMVEEDDTLAFSAPMQTHAT